MEVIIILFFWFIFSWMAATMASNKGQSALFVFFISVIFSPLVGIFAVLVTGKNQAVLDARLIKKKS